MALKEITYNLEDIDVAASNLLNHLIHKAVVFNGTMGAGKTTLATNLAVGFSKAGKSVALMDTDPQGSAGGWFMTRVEEFEDPGLEFSRGLFYQQ